MNTLLQLAAQAVVKSGQVKALNGLSEDYYEPIKEYLHTMVLISVSEQARDMDSCTYYEGQTYGEEFTEPNWVNMESVRDDQHRDWLYTSPKDKYAAFYHGYDCRHRLRLLMEPFINTPSVIKRLDRELTIRLLDY